jgi:predicted ATPase
MGAGFSRLIVEGFRRLRHVDLPLRPFNVLIGANGVGKSSVLGVFDLLAASARGDLERTLTTMGGLPAVLTADGQTNSASTGLFLPEDGGQYELQLMSQRYSYNISHEILTLLLDSDLSQSTVLISSKNGQIGYADDGPLFEPTWDYNPLETALSQTPKMFRRTDQFRERLANMTRIYHVLDISPRAPIRLPQILSRAQTPGNNGDNLISCLFQLKETGRDRFEAIEDALHAAFPTFQHLSFEAQGGGLLALGWADSDFTRLIYANELSEGTLRFLWLATLLQSPGLPKVALFDEPEVSLHPDMLRLLAELMREASSRTQLIVATHSDRFVRFLDPSELVVCDRDEQGGMTVKRADELDLAGWMEDFTLDQLWSNGRLGGRT